MEGKKEHLLNWLRDAHAMEGQALQMLKGEQGRIETYPELKRKIQTNEEIARANQEDLKKCIEMLGGDTSSIKDMGTKIMGAGQALSGVMFGDEVMKTALALSTVHRLALTSYKILISAADTAGYPEIKAICEGILKREAEIAEWLDGQLPQLTVDFLSRAEQGGTAKR